ncbi:hypothetical protein [Streptomyces sp. Z26]|uniref:hypothetical protein n=1 Tax=Streptomyces sp. Z26 TaxID=2500177 RepID=UPI000EF17108|nr:hypothetical protein [Streptomyces sp. Z26]RLL68390.1 hypothetical protein D7M15_17885 [Streptomyces sp. Z26]
MINDTIDGYGGPYSHHFVLTLQKPCPGGMAMGTWNGGMTPQPGWTRWDAYTWLLEQFVHNNPHLSGGNVLFFALEPNALECDGL